MQADDQQVPEAVDADGNPPTRVSNRLRSLSGHELAQQREADSRYAEARPWWFSDDPATRYVTHWRLVKSITRLQEAAGARFTSRSSVLFLCAGDGAEASVCADLFGFTDVTFSDISPVAVATGTARDPRLKGIVADTENTALPDNSYDVVIVQDGLHHLRSPVRGFTEMLRIARVGAVFIEAQDVLIGRLFGTTWEREGDAVNCCFRWSKRLIEQVTASYLGPDGYTNLSFAYWHQNPIFDRLAGLVGRGILGMRLLQLTKFLLDRLLPGCENMISAVILKAEPRPSP